MLKRRKQLWIYLAFLIIVAFFVYLRMGYFVVEFVGVVEQVEKTDGVNARRDETQVNNAIDVKEKTIDRSADDIESKKDKSPEKGELKENVIIESLLVSCEVRPCQPQCRKNREVAPYWGLCAKSAIPLGELHASAHKAVFLILLESRPKVVVRFSDMLQTLDLYYPFDLDVVILSENFSRTLERMIQGLTNRKVIFVDVHQFFVSDVKIEPIPGCDTPLGYRLMCRFMAGPVYWLEELDTYDFVIRMDDDSVFRGPITHDLVAEVFDRNASYAYALDGRDDASCTRGADTFIRQWSSLARQTFDVELGRLQQPITRSNPKYRNEQLDIARSYVMNCNFEVVRLSYFRHSHYRAYWQKLEESGLFLTSRLGDHQAKTLYLDLYSQPHEIICFGNLNYSHAGRMPCKHHSMVLF